MPSQVAFPSLEGWPTFVIACISIIGSRRASPLTNGCFTHVNFIIVVLVIASASSSGSSRASPLTHGCYTHVIFIIGVKHTSTRPKESNHPSHSLPPSGSAEAVPLSFLSAYPPLLTEVESLWWYWPITQPGQELAQALRQGLVPGLDSCVSAALRELSPSNWAVCFPALLRGVL